MNRTSNTLLKGPSNPKLFACNLQRQSDLPRNKLYKRHYKYVHLLIICANKPQLKAIPKLKHLSYLHLTYWRHPPKLSFFKKLIKPFKKSLRNVEGDYRYPALQKLLPGLTHLQVALKQSSWRLLTHRSAFRELAFNLESPSDVPQEKHQSRIQSLLRRYKSSLNHTLPKMKDLRSLNLKVSNINSEFLLFILEVLFERMPLESVKFFHLHLEFGNCSPFAINPRKVGRVLQAITNLKTNQAEEFSSFSIGEFKNLSDLEMSFSCPGKCLNVSNLLCFKNLLKLRRLNLSTDWGRAFFETFSLSETLDELTLKLSNFTCQTAPETNDNSQTGPEIFENDPVYSRFFERLQDCQSLKSLDLSISGNCPGAYGKFASLFIQQFNKLERADYDHETLGRTNETLFIPLDFQDFWKALESSKETLKDVSIGSPEIIFPEKMNLLETGFPRLQSLTVRGDMLWNPEFSVFCQEISSLDSILLVYRRYLDQKELRRFLFSWMFIPQKMEIYLFLYIERIQQQDLADCLIEYIAEVNVKGILAIDLKNNQKQALEAFEEIFKLDQFKNRSLSISKDFGASTILGVELTGRTSLSPSSS